VRCFDTGNRLGLGEEDIRRVSRSDETVEFHRKMRELRSKHVAHSVNPLEFIKMGIMVGTLSPNDEEGATGLITLSSAEWEPHPTNLNGLRRLAAGLLGVVVDGAEEQTSALREAVDEIGLDRIKRWPELVYRRGPVDPGTVRETWTSPGVRSSARAERGMVGPPRRRLSHQPLDTEGRPMREARLLGLLPGQSCSHVRGEHGVVVFICNAGPMATHPVPRCARGFELRSSE
jgi:hypothetical protein